MLAEGKTELSGAAIEPEIMDLVAVLQKMGAIISVDVDRTFRIEGVKELNGFTHTSLTDRIEAASWRRRRSPRAATFSSRCYAAGDDDVPQRVPQGRRQVRGDRQGHPFLASGRRPQARGHRDGCAPRFHDRLAAAAGRGAHPANGLSIVHETVYENRFGFTKPLVQMGATIQLYRECLGSLPCRFQQRNYKHSAVIFGPTPLTGRDIDVPDLRGGFSHLIAALAASGPSNVHGISLIDRGYADFRGKLAALGADFE